MLGASRLDLEFNSRSRVTAVFSPNATVHSNRGSVEGPSMHRRSNRLDLDLSSPPVDALPLLSDHYALFSSLVRLVALERWRLFDRLRDRDLADGIELGTLRELLGLAARPTSLIVASLVAAGDLLVENGRIALSARSAAYLGDGATRSNLAPYLGLLAHTCLGPAIDRMAESLEQDDFAPFLGRSDPLYGRGGESCANDDPALARADALAMASRACCLLPAFLDRVPLPHPDGILCSIACGPALYSVGCLLRYPELRAKVVDHPGKGPVIREIAEANGVADRIEFVAGDMFTDDLPKGDQAILSSVLHDWDEDACVEILRRVRESAPLIILHDVFPDGEFAMSKAEADYSLLLGLITPGKLYSVPELDRMLARAALERIGPPRKTAHLYSAIMVRALRSGPGRAAGSTSAVST
jgi:hypothetical protein